MQLLLLQSVPKLHLNQKKNLYFTMKTITVLSITAIPGEEIGIGAMEAEIGDRTTLPNQRRKAMV